MLSTRVPIFCLYKKLLTIVFFVYTLNEMDYEYDPAKDESNSEKHGLSLADAEGFIWEDAIVREDARSQYPERRFEAIGYIRDRLHVIVFCIRKDVIRVISLRKANVREVKRYAEA